MNMFKNLEDMEKVRRLSSAEVVNNGQATHGLEYWILT